MKYSIGVLDYRPSKQLAGQYDELAKLEDYRFTLLYRRPEFGNPAWPSEFCKSCENIVLPQLPQFLVRNLLFDRNIRPVLDKYNFDALIIFGLYDSMSVWQAFAWCRDNHKPCFIRCDSNAIRDTRYFRRLLKGRIISRRIRQAAGLLYIGTQNRKYYEYYGAKPEQLFCAPWEIDYSTLEEAYQEAVSYKVQARKQLEISPNTCVLVVASRLVPVKGYDLLVPAIRDLRDKGYDIELLIAGEGTYREKIEAEVSRLSLPIRLLGNLDRKKLVEVFTASDIFVLPSYTEPWGLVVNEAALCGLPIVVSDMVGAGTDLVQDGQNGYIFPAGNREEFVSSIEKLIINASLRTTMGVESRRILQDWRNRFSAIKGYQEALDSVLKK